MTDTNDICPAQHPEGKGGCGLQRGHDDEHAVILKVSSRDAFPVGRFCWPNPEGAARIDARESREQEAEKRAERHGLVFLAALVGGAEAVAGIREPEKTVEAQRRAAAARWRAEAALALADAAVAVYRPPVEEKP